jgi:hypothetical protein
MTSGELLPDAFLLCESESQERIVKEFAIYLDCPDMTSGRQSESRINFRSKKLPVSTTRIAYFLMWSPTTMTIKPGTMAHLVMVSAYRLY